MNKYQSFTEQKADAIIERFLECEPEPEDDRFKDALKEMEHLARNGDSWSAGAIAEVHSLTGALVEPETSYIWYYVHYALEDYSVEYSPTEEGPVYYGDTGDFRNEAPVSELVDHLGIERIQMLDQKASLLLEEIK